MVPLERRFNSEVAVYEPTHPLAFQTGSVKGYVMRAQKVAWDAGLIDDLEQKIVHINGVLDDDRPENLRVRGKLRSTTKTQPDDKVAKPNKEPKPLPPVDDEIEQILFERCHTYMKPILRKEIRQLVDRREQIAYERGRRESHRDAA